MEVEKIKRLLDLYYSGDITPEEYVTLRAAMIEDDPEQHPEVDQERAIFQAIESLEPVMPDGLESRLIEAIDRRGAMRGHWIKVFVTGVAAAVAVLILSITFVLRFESGRSDMSDFIAERMVEDPDTVAGVFSDIEDPSEATLTDEELARRFHIVDHALKDVLSGIRVSPRQASERVNGIHIKQNTLKQNINLNLSK